MKWESESRLPRRAKAALLCAWVLSAQAPASSQDAPAAAPRTVEVLELSFPEGASRLLTKRGSWLPVYVELKALSNQTETVVLEGSVGTRRKSAFVTRERVEVSPGAPRRCWLYLRVGAADEDAAVEVRSASGAVFKRSAWSFSTRAQEQQSAALSMLVVGESLGDVIPWPGELKSVSRRLEDLEQGVDSSRPAQLPDNLLGYQPYDLLILRDLGTQALEASQLEALRSWVYLGGRVIFVPKGRSGEVFRSPAAKLFFADSLSEPTPEDGFVPRGLVVSVDDSRGVAGPGPTRLEGGGKLALSKTHQYTLLDPLRGRAPREIAALTDATGPDDLGRAKRLYAEHGFGRGSAGILTLDDQTYRDSESQVFLQLLWSQIVTWTLSGGKSQFLSQASLFQAPGVVDALKDPAREVGVRVMVSLIGGYIVLAGPVLYIVLKRLNRLPAVIWAEPLLVVGYVGVIFATAYLTKGVLTKTRLVTLISQQEGDPIALRESYLSIFSAAEMSYNITAPKGSSYVRPLYKNADEERPVRILGSKGGELTLEGHALAHWEEGSFSSAGVVDLGGPGIELKTVEGGAEGADRVQVTNHLPYAVTEGVVYLSRRNKTGYALPRIAPGATATVTLSEPLAEDRHEKRTRPFVGASGGGRGGLSVLALVAREDEDFKIDQRTSVKERLDYYLLYE